MSVSFHYAFREALLILIASSVLGFAYTATTGKGLFAPSPAASPADQLPAFLNIEQALQLYESGTAVFLDTRHAYDYDLGHIKGALNLPLTEFDEKKSLLTSIPKDHIIVVYCDGEECNSSIEMAVKLDSLAYSNAKIFFGGWKEWLAHDLPVAR